MSDPTLSSKRKKTASAIVVASLLGTVWLGWREIARTPSLSGSELAWGIAWSGFEEDDFFIPRWIEPDPPTSSTGKVEGSRELTEDPAITGGTLVIPSGAGPDVMKSPDRCPALALAAVNRDRVLESVFGDTHEEAGNDANGAIDSAIQTCARNRSIDLVFDSSFHVGGGHAFMFMGDRVVDLTDEVIATIRKQAKQSATASR